MEPITININLHLQDEQVNTICSTLACFAQIIDNAAHAMAVPSPAMPVPQSAEKAEPLPQAADTASQAEPSAHTVLPTAAPQYTLEMIANAGSALIDAGKLEPLMALLGKYGVDSLVHLPPEYYGAVAQDLRALGAVL